VYMYGQVVYKLLVAYLPVMMSRQMHVMHLGQPIFQHHENEKLLQILAVNCERLL